MSGLVRFGVSLPQDLMDSFDRRIRGKGYRTRSEAIRDIMRGYLVEGEWEGAEGEVVGTVTIVYDHHTRELLHLLTSIQHEYEDEIVCTTHVHMDHDNCLEVIVVRGPRARVAAIADRLISAKGVKNGKLVCTTTGEILK